MADGVLMRTKLAWAIARSDGSVESGPMPRNPFARIPALRIVAGLGSGLKLGVGRGLIRGAKDAGNRRFLILLVVAEVGALFLLFAAGPALESLHPALSTLVSVGAGGLSLTLLRKAAPASLWRFHGAEHKAAAAFEAGRAADDVDAAMAASRLHPRCGTNLLVPLTAVGMALSTLPAAVQVVAGVLALGLVAECLSLAARTPKAVWARLLLGPGLFLQRHVTTSEPTAEEQAVACRAMATCVELHYALAAEVTPRVVVEPAMVDAA